MAEIAWETGKLQAVLHPVGKRANGEQRYVRGNYDVLEWQAPGASAPSQYVVPLSIGERISAGGVNLTDVQIGHEFGYYDLERHVIELHEADGRGDSWRSLHSFGTI